MECACSAEIDTRGNGIRLAVLYIGKLAWIISIQYLHARRDRRTDDGGMSRAHRT
jgi:hypothetical protein